MSEDALNQRACSARLLPSYCGQEGPARSSVAAVCRRGCAEMTGQILVEERRSIP